MSLSSLRSFLFIYLLVHALAKESNLRQQIRRLKSPKSPVSPKATKAPKATTKAPKASRMPITTPTVVPPAQFQAPIEGFCVDGLGHTIERCVLDATTQQDCEDLTVANLGIGAIAYAFNPISFCGIYFDGSSTINTSVCSGLGAGPGYFIGDGDNVIQPPITAGTSETGFQCFVLIGSGFEM
jgi:hypothetical protein